MKQILKLNASARIKDSETRKLVNLLSDHLQAQNGSSVVVEHDLAVGVPLLTEQMINSFYTPADKRTQEQNEIIADSDQYVADLKNSDVIVIGSPIYNFSVPGALKAYFDLVARVGETFKYSEKGPEGLLKGKKAYIIIASGGTPFKSEVDFASDYIKHFLSFIGIEDVTFIAADKLMFDGKTKMEAVKKQILATQL